jgi:two-component system, chemotaxis family, chemotaxis protein CheY
MVTILIVDDSPVMRSFIRRVLAVSGLDAHKPFEADNGRTALELLRAQPVDLVLSDINMPVMNGEELVREMRADESLRGTPVIVVSTDARLDRVDQMMGLGANGYIAKPFTPEALRAELDRVLEMREVSRA